MPMLRHTGHAHVHVVIVIVLAGIVVFRAMPMLTHTGHAHVDIVVMVIVFAIDMLSLYLEPQSTRLTNMSKCSTCYRYRYRIVVLRPMPTVTNTGHAHVHVVLIVIVLGINMLSRYYGPRPCTCRSHRYCSRYQHVIVIFVALSYYRPCPC